MLDAFQRGWIILSLNAVHIVSDFIHEILQRLQIISIIGGVFIVFYTIAVEGAVDFRSKYKTRHIVIPSLGTHVTPRVLVDKEEDATHT